MKSFKNLAALATLTIAGISSLGSLPDKPASYPEERISRIAQLPKEYYEKPEAREFTISASYWDSKSRTLTLYDCPAEGWTINAAQNQDNRNEIDITYEIPKSAVDALKVIFKQYQEEFGDAIIVHNYPIPGFDFKVIDSDGNKEADIFTMRIPSEGGEKIKERYFNCLNDSKADKTKKSGKAGRKR